MKAFWVEPQIFLFWLLLKADLFLICPWISSFVLLFDEYNDILEYSFYEKLPPVSGISLCVGKFELS